ncbi:putative RNA-binding Zn ribbon-like protein [Actinopolyspora biskrensis]|uniref:Putative RNA-binding Zn ribbon-like protein n=1 Tax=Actinopolyspora biskrensis TaxID=1470178 RepID=A0A852YTF6_9ACTN|nr:CGNR zinc finger domain-containing protein [Actinopolyspora biskrensis]NYH77981.1 putative RNA-binding Zn ribbon-like protein [Actinopolyspora biskrensis]
MDNADYIAGALRLANARTDDLETLRAELHGEPWWSSRLTEQDLKTLRAVAASLRQSIEAAVSGEHEALTAEVNRLLATYPPRPRLSRGEPEQHRDWHVHIADVETPPAAGIAAAAAWGLAQGIVRHGTERWGKCDAPACGTYFLDTSTNRARQFCSARCANRVHVAAFRQRRRS